MNDELTYSMNIRPAGEGKRVGRLYYRFAGIVEGQTQQFTMFFPMDRRQARRVSRKIGRKFRMVDGDAKFI